MKTRTTPKRRAYIKKWQQEHKGRYTTVNYWRVLIPDVYKHLHGEVYLTLEDELSLSANRLTYECKLLGITGIEIPRVRVQRWCKKPLTEKLQNI